MGDWSTSQPLGPTYVAAACCQRKDQKSNDVDVGVLGETLAAQRMQELPVPGRVVSPPLEWRCVRRPSFHDGLRDGLADCHLKLPGGESGERARIPVRASSSGLW